MNQRYYSFVPVGLVESSGKVGTYASFTRCGNHCIVFLTDTNGADEHEKSYRF
jgi:hypothetical protein